MSGGVGNQKRYQLERQVEVVAPYLINGVFIVHVRHEQLFSPTPPS
jgi:hypothetical protein